MLILLGHLHLAELKTTPGVEFKTSDLELNPMMGGSATVDQLSSWFAATAAATGADALSGIHAAPSAKEAPTAVTNPEHATTDNAFRLVYMTLRGLGD